MFAMMVRRAPPLAALGGLCWPATAWAGRELPLMTADDNLGLLALVSALVGFWLYFHATTEDQA